MELSKQERKKLIKEISQSSGIAQYALQQKMTDGALIQVAQHQDILLLLKSSNTYNRYCQGQKTKEANDKFKAIRDEFLNFQNSEIVKAGQWLISALSSNGQARKQKLLEKDLLHKQDYNQTVLGYQDTIEAVEGALAESTENASQVISSLEERIDNLKNQLFKIRSYIINNYGSNVWKIIEKTFTNN